jgi:DNA-binding winged helix-turn-helix (wHTH) protein
MLVERAERLVTKQELFEQVWGGLAVGDDALTSCIQELHQALGTTRAALDTSKHSTGGAID